ncbi:MAG: formylglycine-generating enzyme family protein [Chloroflexota bacterium]
MSPNSSRSWNLKQSIIIFIIPLILTGIACSTFPQSTPTPATQPTAEATPAEQVGDASSEIPSQLIHIARQALASSLDTEPESLSLASAELYTFQDSSLECPRPGEIPLPQATRGYRLVFDDGNLRHAIHTNLDGTQVRCLDRPVENQSGFMSVIHAIENKEYGTLASQLPSSLSLSVAPHVAQQLTLSQFINELRSKWLGPGWVTVDLNTNVVAAFPALSLPPDHIPIYSKGWGEDKSTVGILLFNSVGQRSELKQLVLIPPSYQSRFTLAQPEQTPGATEIQLAYSDCTLTYPGIWQHKSSPDGVTLYSEFDDPVLEVRSWTRNAQFDHNANFLSQLESAAPDSVPNLISIYSADPIWALSGEPGYLVTWVLKEKEQRSFSLPQAVFSYTHQTGLIDRFAIAIDLLNPDYHADLNKVLATISCEHPQQIAGRRLFQHDILDYSVNFRHDWKVAVKDHLVTFYDADDKAIATINLWDSETEPSAFPGFEEWLRAELDSKPTQFADYALVALTPAEGDPGFLVRWVESENEASPNPIAFFPFLGRSTPDGNPSSALAVTLLDTEQSGVLKELAGDLAIPNKTESDMVFVEGGPFFRGSTEAQVESWNARCLGVCRPDEFTDELVQRQVSVSSFFIDRTEVTVAQYKEFVQETGYLTTADLRGDPREFTWRAYDYPDRQDHPVRWLSWEDANQYCRWAGKRLPTEAEWEKAARGAEGRTWPWGNDWTGNKAPQGDTSPVDAYPDSASPYGALGMAGNVWEWVADWYQPNYYLVAPAVDPLGPAGGNEKVLRGGSFNNSDWAHRTAHRHSGGLLGYAMDHGVRCAKDP